MTDDHDPGSHQQPRSLRPHQEWDHRQSGPIGRDPRRMSPAELEALGLSRQTLLSAIRAKCVDCCAGNKIEVRRCGMVDCPSWPFRMATNPWHR
jgi:hypothetical protein